VTKFEKHWHERWMSDNVDSETLYDMVNAGLLQKDVVDGWVSERKHIYGF
jgi:hypothetical protein